MYIHILTYTYLYIHIHTYTYICIHMHTYANRRMQMHTDAYRCIQMHTDIHTHTHTYIYRYLYIIHKHTHTYTYIIIHPSIHLFSCHPYIPYIAYIHAYITLHYSTVQYSTLHYITYITLHYVTLRYVTLRYITYIHTYIQTDIHTYIQTASGNLRHIIYNETWQCKTLKISVLIVDCPLPSFITGGTFSWWLETPLIMLQPMWRELLRKDTEWITVGWLWGPNPLRFLHAALLREAYHLGFIFEILFGGTICGSSMSVGNDYIPIDFEHR